MKNADTLNNGANEKLKIKLNKMKNATTSDFLRNKQKTERHQVNERIALIIMAIIYVILFLRLDYLINKL